MTSPIFISSDHAGIKLKSFLLKNLTKHLVTDLGPLSDSSGSGSGADAGSGAGADSDAKNFSVDYPDFADLVCKKIQEHNNSLSKGILICGSGQGMVMRANKYHFIKAGLCHTSYCAKLIRQHNDANVLCLAARPVSEKENADFINNPSIVNNKLFANALKIVETFLSSDFQGGRHNDRVKKLQTKVTN